MFKKSASIVAGVFLLVSPSLAFALPPLTETQLQINALLAQVQQLTALIAQLQEQKAANAKSSSACISLARDFSEGSTDAGTNGEVSKLQRFLGVNPTGYFGPLTSRALQTWQNKNGITITTFGRGAVGPKTRAAMMQTCSQTNQNSHVSVVVPKAGDVVVSGKTTTVQIAFSDDIVKKVESFISARKSNFEFIIFSMGLLSKRTGEIIPLNDSGISSIRSGLFTFTFTPRTAVAGDAWIKSKALDATNRPVYLVGGEYKVVFRTKDGDRDAENITGKIYSTNDGWFTIQSGEQSGVSFEITHPQGEQSYSKGDVVPLQWRILGSDADFVPKYFSAELVPADDAKIGTFSGVSSCRLTSTFGGIAIPSPNTFDWTIPTSGTGMRHLADAEVPLCSMTGVPTGKYRIVANISTCSGFGCWEDPKAMSISDSSGIFEIR